MLITTASSSCFVAVTPAVTAARNTGAMAGQQAAGIALAFGNTSRLMPEPPEADPYGRPTWLEINYTG